MTPLGDDRHGRGPYDRTHPQLSHDIGQLKAMVGDSTLRIDKIEDRFESIERHLVTMISLMGRVELKNVALAAVAGAFCGTFSGVAAAVAVLYYVAAQGWMPV